MQHIQTGKLPHSSTAGPSHGGDTSAYLAALAAVPRYSCQEKENRCYNYPHPQTLDHHRPLTSSPLALWSSSSSSSSPPGASMSSPPPSSDLDFDEVLRTPLQNTKYYNVDPTPSSSSSPLRSISANAQHLDTSSGFTKVPPARTHTSSSSSRSRMYKSTSSVRARDTMAPQTPAHGARSERIFFHATQRARGERGSIVDKRRNGLLGDAIRSGLETEEELAILRKQYRLDRARLERDFDMEQARSGSTLEEEVEEKQEEYARAGIAEETTQAAAGGAWMDHNNAQEEPPPDAIEQDVDEDLIAEYLARQSSHHEQAVNPGPGLHAHTHASDSPTIQQDADMMLFEGDDEDFQALPVDTPMYLSQS